MSNFEEAQLRNELSRLAKREADRKGLTLNQSGQEALGDLVTIATGRIEAGDVGQIERAERSFRRLANVLADEGVDRSSRSATRAHGEIDDTQLRAALIKLCPGFWPFC